MIEEAEMGKKHPSIAELELRAHERVCTERYGNINQALIEIKQNQTTFAVQNDARFNTMATEHRQSYTSMSNRMWAILITSLGGLLMAFCMMAFYLITGAK
jgi:hypothetical protein